MAVSPELKQFQRDEANWRHQLICSDPKLQGLLNYRGNDSDRPSRMTTQAWAWASDSTKRRPVPVSGHDSGKWMLFPPSGSFHDTDWAIIRAATQYGFLGCTSKTSTNIPNPNAINQDTKLICIYTTLGGAEKVNTGNVSDPEVRRILLQLRDLGFCGRLNYKTDDATMAGQYANRGHTNVCAISDDGFGCTPWWESAEEASTTSTSSVTAAASSVPNSHQQQQYHKQTQIVRENLEKLAALCTGLRRVDVVVEEEEEPPKRKMRLEEEAEAKNRSFLEKLSAVCSGHHVRSNDSAGNLVGETHARKPERPENSGEEQNSSGRATIPPSTTGAETKRWFGVEDSDDDE